LIQNMLDRSMERITGDRWVDKAALAEAAAWPREQRQRRWHIGIDVARKTDFTVIFVIDTLSRPARVVAYRRMNRVPWETIYREIGRHMAWFTTSALIDSTGMAGDVILDALEGRRFCPRHDRTVLIDPNGGGGICRDKRGEPLPDCRTQEHVSLGAVEGFPFSTNSKNQLMEHLRNTLSVGYRQGSTEPYGWLRTPPILQLEEEMSFYAWDDKGLDTDTVMALALAAWQGLEDVPQAILFGSVHGQ